MRKFALTAVLVLSAMTQVQAVTIFPGLMGKQLIDSVRANYKTSTCLSYDNARAKVYGEIDITADSLVCPYSGYVAHGGPTAAPLTWAGANDINCEHSWPQSLLASQSPDPTCDMNHLFGTEMQVNSYRGNLPYGECADNLTSYWSRDNVHQTTVPTANIDEWAETITNSHFEPRESHKGKAARAMYYMLTMYQLGDTTAAFWTFQRDTLYKWHCQHPATAAESTRTSRIAAYQSGKVNPFIMDSTLIRRCYFPSITINTQVNFAATAATYGEAAGSFNLTVNIASPSSASATTVQVVLAGGTGSAADVNNYTTQTLTFPAGSTTPQPATITITDDTLVEGTETVIFKLRNVTGGSSASIGADSVFTLTILDNDAPTTTTVSFNPVAISRTEGNPPFAIVVNIANPGGSAATTADVVLSGGTGSAADINNYATQTLTFPAGSAAPESTVITITDDTLVEGTETLVFKLRNVAGGNSAAAGADSTFTLTLYDNDVMVPGPFTETMGTVTATTAIAAHETANGFDNDGLTMSGTADVRITTPSSGYTGASGSANIFITNTAGRNFLISDINTLTKAPYTLSFGVYKSTTTSNGSDLVVEVSSDGATFSPLTVPALPTGTGTVAWYYRTASGTIPSAANLRIQFRQTGTATQFRIDDVKLERAMGVALSGFSCGCRGGEVQLRWRTECEDNTYRWVIERAENGAGPYLGQAVLTAAGSSNQPHEYQWTDRAVAAGATYCYRLGQQDLNGAVCYYGPVSAIVPLANAALGLHASPNPFSSATAIKYQLAGPHRVDLRIYNAAGQLVRIIADAPGDAGGNSAAWDGRDQHGRAAVPGVYFYRWAAGATSQLGRLVLVR